MTFYKEMQNIAKGVLNEFNQGSIKLVQLVESPDGSPDKPGDMQERVYNLKGSVKGVSFKYLKEGYVIHTDLEATVAVIPDVQPTLNDFVEVDGVRYKIIRDVSVPAAGTKVVWKFLIRKGG